MSESVFPSRVPNGDVTGSPQSPQPKNANEPNNPLLNTLGKCKMTDRQKLSVLRRLEEKSAHGKPQTTIDGPCRLWTGCKIHGYGVISIALGKIKYAHRASYEVTYDVELPKHIQVRHLCANPVCTKPDHLDIGSVQDNANDRVDSGRTLAGERHPKTNMLNETALAIAAATKISQSDVEIGRRFNCSRRIVHNIRAGRSWSSITGIKRNKQKTCRKKIDLQRKDEEKAKKYVHDHIEKVKEGNHTHWIWKLKARIGGYGQAHFHYKTYSAHAFSWRAFHQCRKIPNGMCILHGCKQKDCVNPYSLTLGDPKKNAADKVRDGTLVCGVKHRNAKLTEKQVEEIRGKHAKGASQTALAKNYRITQAMVSLIVLYKSWKHI